jgi:hypothetical protein
MGREPVLERSHGLDMGHADRSPSCFKWPLAHRGTSTLSVAAYTAKPSSKIIQYQYANILQHETRFLNRIGWRSFLLSHRFLPKAGTHYSA